MDHSQRLPNLLIPGVGKSGTSSLFWYLSQHPDICAADKKEINYFKTLRFGEAPVAPIEQYAAHFSHCLRERYRLDASQVYFDGGEQVRSAIRKHFLDPKILPILRDPVDRLFSSYQSSRNLGTLDPSVNFAEFFEECRRLRSSGEDLRRENGRFRALRTSYYIDHARAWFDEFDDVRIVFLEDMVADPHAFLVDICEWLEIDVAPVDDVDFAHRNKTVQHRSRALFRVANAVNLRLDRGLRIGPRMKHALRSVYWALNAADRTERLHPADRARAAEYFAASNAALRDELLQRGYRQVPSWLSEAGLSTQAS